MKYRTDHERWAVLIWKEVAVCYLKIPSRYSPEETDENHYNSPLGYPDLRLWMKLDTFQILYRYVNLLYKLYYRPVHIRDRQHMLCSCTC
jgi:hypothetical protein